MTTSATNPIGIIGAGTMGTGIAQAAASAGWTVYLYDISPKVVDKAQESIAKRFNRLVEKGRITAEKAVSNCAKIIPTTSISDLEYCDLIIEAIVEDLEIKAKVLQQAGDVAPNAIIATNTSSLSVNDLGIASTHANRVIGMHFFNPAPIMPLVEIVSGSQTSEKAIKRTTLLAEAWGKTVVFAADTPGFIVNRVARPYYLESWRIIEDGIASVDEIDETMQTLGEFKMGPFYLTDLIGQDINVATTRSVWERMGKPSRLAPSELQETLVKNKHLGRKTGRGAYAHNDENTVVPAIVVNRTPLEISDRLHDAVNNFCLEATCVSGSLEEKYVFARVLASIINEAMWTLEDKVATIDDIDTAMKLGTNYPNGPIEWAHLIGLDHVEELLLALNETVSDNRFESPPIGTVTAN